MKFLAILLLIAPFNAEKYLNNIKGFSTDSYFKSTAYNDSKTLDETADAEQLVNVQNFDLHLMNWCLFAASNEMRSKYHSKPLLFSERLRNAAMIHSNEMVVNKFYHHINPKNNELKMPDQRMKLFGISNVELAENVHKFPFENNNVSYKTLARAIVKDFYDSPNHRKNLLNNNFNHLGCAAMWEFDEKEKFYFMKVTQCFAKL
jgi:uncharacterized protein YkwD